MPTPETNLRAITFASIKDERPDDGTHDSTWDGPTFTPGRREEGDSLHLSWWTDRYSLTHRDEAGDADEDGIYWVTHSFCDVGDYGGSGSVGAANIAYLEREYSEDCWVVHGSHGYRQAYLRDTRANRELLATLDDHPLFSDDDRSNVESDWEQEAWDSWLRSDLVSTLPEWLQEWAGYIERDGVDPLWECYRDAMERENEYPIPEHSGVTVRVKEIQDTFALLVTEQALLCVDWSQPMLLALAPTCPIILDGSAAALCIALDWMEEHPGEWRAEPGAPEGLWMLALITFRARQSGQPEE